jgi:hypothetical protein
MDWSRGVVPGIAPGVAPVASGDPQDLLAGVSREQYADYVARYQPMEEELIGELLDPTAIRHGVRAAGREAKQAFARSRGSFLRDAERAGIPLKGARKKDFTSRFRLAKTAGIVDAKNRAREGYDDLRTSVMQGLTQTGRGLAQTATSNLQSAAGLQTQREGVNRQLEAQSDASFWSGLGTLGGLTLGAVALCWVARAVYGDDNPRWLLFRAWLLTRAPGWLLRVYRRHGPAVADFLRPRPWLQRPVRWLMDHAISTLEDANACATG